MKITRLHYYFGGEKHEVWVGKESSPVGKDGAGRFKVWAIEIDDDAPFPAYKIWMKATHSMDSTEVIMTVPAAMAIAIWR